MKLEDLGTVKRYNRFSREGILTIGGNDYYFRVSEGGDMEIPGLKLSFAKPEIRFERKGKEVWSYYGISKDLQVGDVLIRVGKETLELPPLPPITKQSPCAGLLYARRVGILPRR